MTNEHIDEIVQLRLLKSELIRLKNLELRCGTSSYKLAERPQVWMLIEGLRFLALENPE